MLLSLPFGPKQTQPLSFRLCGSQYEQCCGQGGDEREHLHEPHMSLNQATSPYLLAPSTDSMACITVTSGVMMQYVLTLPAFVLIVCGSMMVFPRLPL